jgi:photosystem II stability/assembly factor-like uncharacterized protein
MCDAIVRTRDGGRTWLAIPAPATSPDQLSAVRFANLSDGFITGTQLWATHDGGATWRVVPGYANVTELEAGGGRVWLIAQHGLRSAPVVGGAFTTEATPAGVMGLVPHGPDLFGTTTGGLPKLLVGRHGAPFVARSTPCVRDEAAIVGSRSSRQLLLVCAGGAGAGHQVKKAYISADAGRTWQRVGDPDPTSGTTISLTSRADFVIDHQQVAVSRDGGRTWRSSLAAEGGMGSGGFASDELGFAIGYFGQANAMQLSYDDGRTWKKVSF